MTTTEPTVSVIIPTCNRALYVAEAIESVLHQTQPPSQVIVVNDGSTDATLDVLEPFRGRIELLNQANAGKSAALNTGLQRANGSYIWLFDDDDIALPRALQKHTEVLEADPDIDFTYAPYFSLAMDGWHQAVSAAWYPVSERSPEEVFVRLLEGCFIQHQTVVARAECYRQAGPFDPVLTRSQDYEMMLRLARRFRGRRVDEPTFLYRQHDRPRGRAGAEFEEGHRNEHWYRFNEIIIRRFYDELELHEYLPGRRPDSPLTDDERRSALLQRMCIVSRNLCFDETLRDLQAMTEGPLSEEPLSAEERDVCRRAFHSTLDEFEPLRVAITTDGFLRKVIRFCGGTAGNEIRSLFGRSFLRYGCMEWGWKHYRWAFSAWRAALRLLGLKKLLKELTFRRPDCREPTGSSAAANSRRPAVSEN